MATPFLIKAPKECSKKFAATFKGKSLTRGDVLRILFSGWPRNRPEPETGTFFLPMAPAHVTQPIKCGRYLAEAQAQSSNNAKCIIAFLLKLLLSNMQGDAASLARARFAHPTGRESQKAKRVAIRTAPSYVQDRVKNMHACVDSTSVVLNDSRGQLSNISPVSTNGLQVPPPTKTIAVQPLKNSLSSQYGDPLLEEGEAREIHSAEFPLLKLPFGQMASDTQASYLAFWTDKQRQCLQRALCLIALRVCQTRRPLAPIHLKPPTTTSTINHRGSGGFLQ